MTVSMMVSAQTPKRGSPLEVLFLFLRLGCTSFGGPIAHLGYFQKELVARRQWCSETTYAELIALAQSLPGPASSQVGFGLGILRAGWLGGIAAWLGFTLPSAVLMLAFALAGSQLTSRPALALLHGLQLVAVAVVAQAVLAMQQKLAPNPIRIAFALAAAAVLLLLPSQLTTLGTIAAAALVGYLLFRRQPQPAAEPIQFPLSKSPGLAAAAILILLLALSFIAPFVLHASPGQPPAPLAIFAAFYRSGALVFGGGHVVLPLLQSTVVAPGWVPLPAFLSGYGAAQALPGPVFTFAAYLGAKIAAPSLPVQLPVQLVNGLVALIALFAPGLLALAAVLPWWSSIRSNPSIRAALTGMNAAVVGILLAALIQPLATATLKTPFDAVIAATAFSLLVFAKLPSWLVVAATAASTLVFNGWM